MWFNAAMKDTSREAIASRASELEGNSELARWVEAVDRHIETGQDEFLSFYDEAQFAEFLKLIGHDSISSGQILAYHYSSLDVPLEKNGKNMNFRGKWSVAAVQAALGDTGMDLEYPNDFKVGLAATLDAETMVVYDHKTTTEPEVCNDCKTSTDPDLIEELASNIGHNCDHGIETYHFTNYAILTKISSREESLGLVAN